MESSCPQELMPGGLVKGCAGGQPLPSGCSLLAKVEALLPAPAWWGLPGAGDQSPPDGSRAGHESLRFSFSEQRVSLNCL